MILCPNWTKVSNGFNAYSSVDNSVDNSHSRFSAMCIKTEFYPNFNQEI